MPTISKEDYLKTIYAQKVTNVEFVTTSKISQSLDVTNSATSEMANKLSILPDFHAWLRLLRKPEDLKKERPELFEVRVLTEHMTEDLGNPEMAAYIKETLFLPCVVIPQMIAMI